MENLKPTQNPEQEQRKTLRDYVVATFHADLDIAKRPLTVIRSGKDKGDVIYEGGWIPGAMLCVCNTDPEKGAGPTELFVEVYKTIKVNEEYFPVTGIVPLNILRSLKENGVFTESYIQVLYGKTTEEMLKEGAEAAEQIWRQKHPDSRRIESLAPEVRSGSGAESPSNGSVVEKDGSDFERPSINEVSPKIGSTAVKAAGIKKPIDTNKVKTNEPVREPVETDKTGVGSPALKIPEPTMELIRATEVNDSVGLPAVKPAKKPAEIDKVGANPADLVATEPVKKLVEADKASTDLIGLPAVKSVEKPVETNEANAGVLPGEFKFVVDNFEKLTKENNGQFSRLDTELNVNLSQLKELIIRDPAALKDSRITEFVTTASSRTREFEASRAESVNKFKNDVSDLVEESKNKIENDDERNRRLIKLTKDVDEMSVGSTALGNATNTLIDKLTEIVRIVSDAQGDGWGMDGYISRIVTVIGEIADSDLPSVNRRRRSILEAIEVIKAAEG